MIRIVSVQPLEAYKLAVRFSDRTEGVVDLSAIERRGVFTPWNDPAYFNSVRIDSESGTIVWPNGADIDPYVLYAEANRISIEQALSAAFHDA